MGHIDENFNIRVSFKRSSFFNLWRGFEVRISNIFLYSLLYFLCFDEKKTQSN